MKLQQKKAVGDMWWILALAIVAIVAGGLFLYVIKEGISKTEQNVLNLDSCRIKGGTCKIQCRNDETGFPKSGCPEIIDGQIADEKKDICCIKKNNA